MWKNPENSIKILRPDTVIAGRKGKEKMKLFKWILIAGTAVLLFPELAAQKKIAEYKPEPPDRYKWVRSSSERFTRMAKRFKTRDILFIGDSITSQWLASPKIRYSGGLEVWKKYFVKNSLNFGISGDKIEHVLWRITEGQQLDHCQFSVIVLMIGTNNILSSQKTPQTLEQIAHGNKQIIDIILKKQPRAKILLLSILPLSFDGKTRDKMADDILPHLQKLADNKRVFFLNVAKLFRNEKGKKILLRDGVHPSPEGYQKMAELIKPETERLLMLVKQEKAKQAASGK